ncbi:hypothetical protein [cf. Phormidesmis sp. LEGE 11477]|uniref:hypothetical protein n=1 Tax=cf. Phormidesmis sp. LEGE 11477 TaxID=1828680 RepID=UPI00187F78D9|nr:hypothetical protein [cf. Phormidesmis sp. LEGE 11477]MBE9061230.1 hypothetical protein [cf. Phormidesmis sp. LEGE 11477]
MSAVQELHQKAMDLAEQADLAKLRGPSGQVQSILKQALALESEAAQLIAHDISAEPSRSVLHRSAASLAIECGELQLAEKLIARALAGTPPADIEEELKDLFIQINLPNYLSRQGIELTESQRQLLAY